MCERRLAAAIASRVEGVEVSHVLDLPEGAKLSDAEVLEYAASEHCIVVTRDIGDFVLLYRQWRAEGRECPPIVMLTRRYEPRPGRSAVGAIATDLAASLRTEPGPNAVIYLQASAR